MRILRVVKTLAIMNNKTVPKYNSTYQSRIHKSKRALSCSNALLVDESQYRTPKRSRKRGPANCVIVSSVDNNLILSYSRYIWIASTTAVIHLIDICDVIEAAVNNDLVIRAKRQRSLHLIIVRLNSVLLIIGDFVDVAETTTTWELGSGNLFKYLPFNRRCTGVCPLQLGTANSEDIRARLGEGRCEYSPHIGFLVRADTTQVRCNAVVARGYNNGNSLQAKLQILVALAVLVVVGKKIFNGAIRDRYHISRLVHAALELSLISHRRRIIGVWIERIGA